MRPLPELRFHFNTRNGSVSDLVKTINIVGYPASHIAQKSIRAVRIYHTQLEDKPINSNLINVFWAGPLRKARKGIVPPRQDLAFAECGYLPHYNSILLDPRGHLYHGSMIDYELGELTEEQDNELQDFLDINYFNGVDREMKPQGIPDPPYILFPLQHQADSVIKYDAETWSSDYGKLVYQFSQLIPKEDTLVVKQHPKHRAGLILPTLPNVFYIDNVPDHQNDNVNHYLMTNATCMISINSSFILEALACDLPVISMGRGIFSGKGVTKEISDLDLNRTLFDNLVWDRGRARSLLHELCLYRQIRVDDFTNPTVVSRVMKRFTDEYVRLWKV